MGLKEKWGMIDPNKYRIYLGCDKMRLGIFSNTLLNIILVDIPANERRQK